VSELRIDAFRVLHSLIQAEGFFPSTAVLNVQLYFFSVFLFGLGVRCDIMTKENNLY